MCSAASRTVGERLAGTAPHAPSWLVLEQPGPWGRRALTESRLDPESGGALEVAAGAVGARVVLARRPGRHPDRYEPASRRIWVASTRPRSSWLLGGWMTDIAAIADLDWTALGAGDADAVRASVPDLQPEDEALLLVCTNGRRDLCCAAKGRTLVSAVRDRLPGRVWETTHLSGHRFAPTAVALPTGYAYGRLDVDSAVAAFTAGSSSQVELEHCRGRSAFPAPGQAADLAVRTFTEDKDAERLDVLSISSDNDNAGPWTVEVGHEDGRRWTVTVRTTTTGSDRPESCGAEPGPVENLVADLPRPARG